MLIQKTDELKGFTTAHRVWQGIPGIARTKGGRTFLTFYSGRTRETYGNYAVLVKSDDGINFSEPIACAFKDGKYRCFDPVLWIDPLDRLWFIWNVMPGEEVFGAICENPDAENIVFGNEFYIGRGIMMNKPLVLTSGEWLFPITVWATDIFHEMRKSGLKENEESAAFTYKTSDNGKTFTRLGGASINNRSFDEHMIYEMKNGVLRMLVRLYDGIGESFSYDRGKNWSTGRKSNIPGPSSRFFIKRLKSGRILLINHVDAVKERKNLCALLSDDDGLTFPYKLMLDERLNVSYPDAIECDDGYIYVTYDRDRGGFKSSIEEAYACAREILIAKICESDIISGAYGSDSYTKRVASKLTTLAAGDKNPFLDEEWDNRNFAKMLIANKTEDPIGRIFIEYPINCINIASFDAKALDKKIAKFEESGKLDEDLLVEIIEFIRKAPTKNTESSPIVAEAKKIIDDNLSEEITLTDIAEKIHVSAHYLAHLFKSTTGTTLFEYRNEERLTRAKHMLINTDKSITDVANEVGFASAAYFTKIFSRSEKTTPREFRKIHKS